MYVSVQQPPTPLSWVLWREGLCSAKGADPFSLGITTTGQCPAVLSAYLEVLIKPKLSFESSLIFQWCISIVLQDFIYLFIYPFIHNPNVLLAYCSKNCQSDKNALNIKDLGELNENSLDYSVSLVSFVLFQAWLPTFFTAATGFICAVLCCDHATNDSKFSRRVCFLPLAAVAVGKLISLQCRIISKGTSVLFCYKDTHLFPSLFTVDSAVFPFCTWRGLTIPKV